MYVKLRGATGRWFVAGTNGDKVRVHQWHPWDEFTPSETVIVPVARVLRRRRLRWRSG